VIRHLSTVKRHPAANPTKNLWKSRFYWKSGGLNVANQSQFAPPPPGQHGWLVDNNSLPSPGFLAKEGSSST
jgi:hypothetical protein